MCLHHRIGAQLGDLFAAVAQFGKRRVGVLAGEYAAASYDEDPEASVFERYELSVNFVGRVA